VAVNKFAAGIGFRSFDKSVHSKSSESKSKSKLPISLWSVSQEASCVMKGFGPKG
jgi:hypothetical protein